MEPSTRLSQLAATIEENKTVIESRAAALDVKVPSLQDGLCAGLATDPDAFAACQRTADASLELNAITKGPLGILTTPAHNIWTSLHIICRFNIANAVPVSPDNRGATFDEIASLTGLKVSTLKRVIRHAITLYIFEECPRGTVRHNAASLYLAKTPEMRQWVGMVMEELWPAATKLADALERWPGSENPLHASYCLAHGTDTPAFQFLTKHPARIKRFADSMTWFSSGPGHQVSHLVDNYRWEEFVNRTVVDVGGSFGECSTALVQKFPSLQCIVQDLPGTIAQAETSTNMEMSHVQFMAHDFFEDQPIRGAAVYLLRQVLHDWSDHYAVKILRKLVAASDDNSVILVMEQIMPEPGSEPRVVEQIYRSFDLGMLALQNGQERDIADWRKLCSEADPSLQITNVIQPTGSVLGLLEMKLC